MTIQSSAMDRFPTGIAGLDTITRGGLLASGVYIVQGVPGSGKTILANEICYRHVAHGGRAIYVTLLAEAHSRMLQHLRSMAFFDESVIPDKLYYISAFRMLEDEGLKGLLDVLRREIRAQHATLLILDGLVAAEEFAPSAREFKKFIHELQGQAVANDCTILLLTSGGSEMVRAEHTMVDGLIELCDEHVDVRTHRTLSVRKFRGSGALRGKHSFRITSEGIQLYPRVEAAFDRPSKDPDGLGKKLSTGSKSLDRMLAGGISDASVTGVVGPTGAGKTLLGLQYLAQCSAAEPGLMFTFYETPARLIDKARAFGQDISRQINKGHLEIQWHPQAEHLLDELGHKLLRAVAERGVKRLVIDGLGGFVESVMQPERIGRFMACLANELRAQRVAAILAIESSDIVGPSVRMPVNGVSAIIENLIFLRFVERNSTLQRLISVTKMRNSAYDEHVRQLAITSNGIEIGEPLFGLEDVITGTSHKREVVAAPKRSVVARRKKK
ncbi:MAG TPA: ATPase domain-containing protein [Steroidobacteraceae bacterium]|nr:ATPase domain-containing protein [Steroidobacteraceae bacterium]